MSRQEYLFYTCSHNKKPSKQTCKATKKNFKFIEMLNETKTIQEQLVLLLFFFFLSDFMNCSKVKTGFKTSNTCSPTQYRKTKTLIINLNVAVNTIKNRIK